MKKILTALILAMLLAGSAAPVPSYGDLGGQVSVDPPSPFRGGAFYGIWFGASKTLSEAQDQADKMAANGFAVQIFLTTDWSNLNPEPWYVLTAGIYASEPEAAAVLPQVQAFYPDAYIKYSGTRKASGTDTGRKDHTPFYGVWCGAFKTWGDAQRLAYELQQKGYPALIFLTTDWSSLNREPWYVVTAGCCSTETEAENLLTRVRKDIPDAYVKYSGSFIG